MSAVLKSTIDSRNALIERWHPDCRRMARRIAMGKGIISRFDDFWPYAEDALIYSAERFDESKGASFSTFLYRNIEFWVAKFRREYDYSMPSHLDTEHNIYRAADALGVDPYDPDNDLAIAHQMNLPYRLLRQHRETVQTSRNLANGTSLSTFEDPSKDPWLCDRKDKVLTTRLLINELLCSLTERERQVIFDRFFGGHDLATVARKLKCSGERVRQIESEALAKMRKAANS